MVDIFADIAAYYNELYVKPERYEREAASTLFSYFFIKSASYYFCLHRNGFRPITVTSSEHNKPSPSP